LHGDDDSDIASQLAAGLIAVGNNHRHEWTDYQVNSYQNRDYLGDIGKTPTRPAIPPEVERPKYEG
jgi:hypothetical protein